MPPSPLVAVVEPTTRAREAARERMPVRSVILPVLCFLPYAAISAGENTNVPLASVFSLLFLGAVVRTPRIAGYVTAIGVVPVVVLYLQNVTGGAGHGDVRGLLTWIVAILPFAACAVAAHRAPRSLLRGVRFGAWASMLYTAAQGVVITAGTLPFPWIYHAAGYADVRSRQDVILQFVRRPFGWFPEPSFMAGTLALGCAAVIVLAWTVGDGVRPHDHVLVVSCAAVILWGQSGSAVFVLPLLLALLLLPGASAARRTFAGVVAVPLVVYAGVELVRSRYSSANYSWTDRGASIVAAFRYLFGDPYPLLLGVGRGGVTAMFDSGLISIDGLSVSTPVPDIFSTTGRILVENGLVGGTLVLAALGAPIAVWAGRRLGAIYGLVTVLIWIVVGFLTITYDTASWIYALPGIALGASLWLDERAAAPRERTASLPGRYGWRGGVIGGGAVLALVAAGLLSPLWLPRTWTSEAAVVVPDRSWSYSSGSDQDRLNAARVRMQTLKTLVRDDRAATAGSGVTVVADPGSSVLHVSATSTDARAAADATDATAQAVVAAAARIGEIDPTFTVSRPRIVERAEVATEPASPRPWQSAALGGVGGAWIVLTVWLRWRLGRPARQA